MCENIACDEKFDEIFVNVFNTQNSDPIDLEEFADAVKCIRVRDGLIKIASDKFIIDIFNTNDEKAEPLAVLQTSSKVRQHLGSVCAVAMDEHGETPELLTLLSALAMLDGVPEASASFASSAQRAGGTSLAKLLLTASSIPVAVDIFTGSIDMVSLDEVFGLGVDA
jgi:hypothetical protein